jgi:hypothetical protein
VRASLAKRAPGEAKTEEELDYQDLRLKAKNSIVRT